jgi:Glycosyl transferase family 2
MAKTPIISVVTCVLDDWRVLRLLASLATQTLAPQNFEAIIVTAGTEDYGDLLTGWPFAVKHVRSSIARLSAQRNLGFSVVDGTYYATTDADCVADSHWLDSLVRRFEQEPTDLVGVGGSIDKYSHNTMVRRFGITIDDGQRSLNYLPASPLPYITGANSSYRTSAVHALGGYDEHFVCGEDVDISYRLQYAGGRLMVDPAAKILHEDRANLWQHLRRFDHYAVDQALLFKKHQLHRPAWQPYVNPHPWFLLRECARLIAASAKQSVCGRDGRDELGEALVTAAEAIGILSGDVRGSLTHRVLYL